MLDIRIIDGEFEIGGDFDLGYMGVYDDDMISIENTPGEVREWAIVADSNKEDCTDEELAKFLTKYFNDFEKKGEEEPQAGKQQLPPQHIPGHEQFRDRVLEHR